MVEADDPRPPDRQDVLDEDGVIRTLRRLIGSEAPGVVVGPGDDAAVVEVRGGQAVLTADMLVEGVHFDLAFTSAADLGYKALAVNVSDVAAVGGSPRFALVSLALPADLDAGWLVELYGGLREAAAEYAVAIVGGDLSRSDRVVVSVAMTGEAAEGRAVRRSGARPGDVLVVTGRLGAAAGGLALLRAPAATSKAVAGAEWAHDLVMAHLRPIARVGEGQTLAQTGAAAMMDLSDGLAKDLSRMCAESGVGAAIRLNDVPLATELHELAKVTAIDPMELALSGGEDYELLAAIRPTALEESRAKMAERFGTPLTVIGEIREASGLVAVEADGTERPLEAKGWDHFGG